MKIDPLKNLVQPLLVSLDGLHERTVKLAAVASVQALLDGKPNEKIPKVLDTFASKQFPVSAKGVDSRRLLTSWTKAVSDSVAHVFDHYEDSAALAFQPLNYIASKWSAEFDLKRSPECLEEASDIFSKKPEVWVYSGLKTSQAITKASQGLWTLVEKLYFTADKADLSCWLGANLDFTLKFVSRKDLIKASLQPGVFQVIDSEDAKVSPGTITAVVSFGELGKNK